MSSLSLAHNGLYLAFEHEVPERYKSLAGAAFHFEAAEKHGVVGDFYLVAEPLAPGETCATEHCLYLSKENKLIQGPSAEQMASKCAYIIHLSLQHLLIYSGYDVNGPVVACSNPNQDMLMAIFDCVASGDYMVVNF